MFDRLTKACRAFGRELAGRAPVKEGSAVRQQLVNTPEEEMEAWNKLTFESKQFIHKLPNTIKKEPVDVAPVLEEIKDWDVKLQFAVVKAITRHRTDLVTDPLIQRWSIKNSSAIAALAQ